MVIAKHVYDLANEGKSRREIARILNLTIFQVFSIIINIKRRHENWNYIILTKDKRE